MNEDHDLANRLAKFGRKMHILKWPRIVVSMRRFRREGTLSVLGKNAIGVLFMITNNPFTKELFDYEMGGKVTSTKKKSLEESFCLKERNTLFQRNMTWKMSACCQKFVWQPNHRTEML